MAEAVSAKSLLCNIGQASERMGTMRNMTKFKFSPSVAYLENRPGGGGGAPPTPRGRALPKGRRVERAPPAPRAIFVDLFWEHPSMKIFLTCFRAQLAENSFSIQGADPGRRAPSAPRGRQCPPPKFAHAHHRFTNESWNCCQ